MSLSERFEESDVSDVVVESGEDGTDEDGVDVWDADDEEVEPFGRDII